MKIIDCPTYVQDKNGNVLIPHEQFHTLMCDIHSNNEKIKEIKSIVGEFQGSRVDIPGLRPAVVGIDLIEMGDRINKILKDKTGETT